MEILWLVLSHIILFILSIDHEERNNQNSENEHSSYSSSHSESSSEQINEEAKSYQENRANRDISFHLHIHNSTMAVLNYGHADLN